MKKKRYSSLLLFRIVIFFFKRNCEWAAYKERREGERKVLKKKKILEIHRNFDYDIAGTI